MSVTITRDEWLSEFERVMRRQRPSDPGMTSHEISEVLGIGQHRVNYLLRAAFRAGRLRVGKKPTAALDGRRCLAPCYQLMPEKKAAKKR